MVSGSQLGSWFVNCRKNHVGTEKQPARARVICSFILHVSSRLWCVYWAWVSWLHVLHHCWNVLVEKKIIDFSQWMLPTPSPISSNCNYAIDDQGSLLDNPETLSCQRSTRCSRSYLPHQVEMLVSYQIKLSRWEYFMVAKFMSL